MSVFHMKGFDIHQDNATMKVGTDGTVLAAYARSWLAQQRIYPRTILDIGTGTGVIALMLAESFPESQVTAIEVDDGAARTAERNFAESPFSDRLALLHRDFTLPPLLGGRFDLIISNPPYHNGSFAPEDARRRLARHADQLTPQILLDRAGALCAKQGIVALIFPIEVEPPFMEAAATAGLGLRHKGLLQTSTGKPPKRVIAFWSLGDRFTSTSERITITRNGCYTDQYATLMRDFLTIF